MNIWIITTGSSDVQLKTENNWNRLHTKVRNQLEIQKQFSSSKSPDGKRYLYPARVMGQVYGTAIETDLKYYEDLDFPLLNNFFWILNGKDGETEKIIIDRVIVLVTDQSKKFKSSEKNNPFSAFWQDTYTLEPIIREYFKRRSIENPEFLILDPDPNRASGLDNWNDVLERVQEKIKEKFSDFKDIQKDTTIYVSHQAGTPAISSAVQFCSLAKFGDRVKFLVSNEYNPTLPEKPLEGSSYLRGIRIQEAKALLKRYDYSGVRSLVGLDQTQPTTPETKRLKYLLDAAEQWNFAEFQKFKKIISDRKLLPQANFPWWKMGYESAYLAWVRLQQGSPVDAMVHSFRAVEGVTSLWAEKTYQNYVQRDPQKGLQLKYCICNKFGNLSYLFGKTDQPKQKIGAYGKALFALLKEDRGQDWKMNSHISTFFKPLDRYYSGKDIFEERNNLFHRLEGLQEQELFEAWSTSDKIAWITRILGCLNFISRQDYQFICFDQKENCNEATSLMVKVHQELVEAIAHL